VKWEVRAGIAAFVLSAAFASPSVAEVFALSDALVLAYQTNPRLESARAKLRAADEQVAEARGGWRPSVGVSSSYGYQNQRTTATGFSQLLQFTPTTAQATLSQPLFTGGQVYAEVRRAMAEDNAARAVLLDTEQQVLLSAATAYMDVVRDTRTLALRHDDVDALRRQREATKTQLDAGEVTRTDLDEVDVRLAGAQANEALAQSQMTQSRDSFERAVGRPAATLDESPVPPRMPATRDQALALAVRGSPIVLYARANERAADYGVDDAVGALLPHASVVAQYDYSQDALSTGFPIPTKVSSFAVLGEISIPIYQGGAEEAKVREAKETHAQTRSDIVDADQSVRQLVDDSWAALEASQTALGFNTQRLTVAQRALAGVIEQQHQGERSTIEILNAEQERVDAELALASSRHDAVVAAYQMLASEGRLTAKALYLRTKLYDPAEHFNEDAGKWIGFGN
jgi:TolC family type I secretion outer membrane protein